MQIEAGNSGAQAEMAQNAQATDMAQSATTTPPPYGPLMVDGVPVPGMLISSDGALHCSSSNLQLNSLP